MHRFNMWSRFILFMVSLSVCGIGNNAYAINNPEICNSEDPAANKPQPPVVTDSQRCDAALEGNMQIPVGDFGGQHLSPLEPARITQTYNNDVGHSGLDLGGECTGEYIGKEEIHAAFAGIVILSYRWQNTSGWGNAVLTATRANDYSDEIITNSYHHLDTRFLGGCDIVNIGGWIGMEGTTGHSDGAHLHYTVRRWKNIRELADTIGSKGVVAAFGGPGYGAQNGTHLRGHLDPEGLLFDSFGDYGLDEYGNPPVYEWSLPYVLDMRHRGIEFGLNDGRFGAGQYVARREAARWIKIAARRFNAAPVTPTFADVPASDSDYPYIEALTGYPSAYPVINKHAGITNGQKYFYPDNPVTRAQALKMVILAFYSAEFLEVYDNDIWKAQKEEATQLLDQFQDVDPQEWFASFVYFGAQKGLVAAQTNFYPYSTVKREEMAKWVSEGAAEIQVQTAGPCSYLFCPADYFCEPATGQCYAIPTCIPSESQACEAGGGYTGNQGGTGGAGGTGGTAGSGGSGTDPCGGYCGPGTFCNSSNGMCELGTGGTGGTAGSAGSGGSGGAGGSGGSGSGGSGGSPAVCTTGQSVACSNCGTMTCDQYGQWGACLDQGECWIGQIQDQTCNGTGTQSRTCGNTCAWGSWGSCSVSQCQDVFLASASPACYTHPGGPTFCISVQQIAGSSWKYQVCKQGATFVNNYKVVLHADNHTSPLGDTYTGNSGDSCTPWRPFSVSYISGYGTANAAGVRAEILSPTSCVQSSCTYSTGTVTLRKECQ